MEGDSEKRSKKGAVRSAREVSSCPFTSSPRWGGLGVSIQGALIKGDRPYGRTSAWVLDLRGVTANASNMCSAEDAGGGASFGASYGPTGRSVPAHVQRPSLTGRRRCQAIARRGRQNARSFLDDFNRGEL